MKNVMLSLVESLGNDEESVSKTLWAVAEANSFSALLNSSGDGSRSTSEQELQECFDGLAEQFAGYSGTGTAQNFGQPMN